MKKETILNSTEKKRNQFSAEYFSKGASSSLKEAFKNNMNSKFNSLVDKFKKEKEEKEKKLKEKEDKIKKLKERKKQLKIGVKTKALAFIAIAASAVIFFKKIEKLFIPFKYRFAKNKTIKQFIDEKRKEDEAIKKNNLQGEEEIRQCFNFSKEQINQIESTVDQFNTKLKTDITENFSNPLKHGVQFFLHLKEKIIEKNPYFSDDNPYFQDEKLTRNWSESQKKNGIIGDFLDTVAKCALIYLINKRGYGFILKYLNLEVPEWEGMDVTMWKVLADDKKLYSHIGRDITGPSRLGDKLMSDIQKRISVFDQTTDEIQKSLKHEDKEVSNAFWGHVQSKSSTQSVSLDQTNKILENIKSNENMELIISKGRFQVGSYKTVGYDDVTNQIQESDLSTNYSLTHPMATQQPTFQNLDDLNSTVNTQYGPISRSTETRYLATLNVVDEIIEDGFNNGESHLFGSESPFNGFPKKIKSKFPVFDEIIFNGGTYITEMYPLLKHDERMNSIITDAVNYMKVLPSLDLSKRYGRVFLGIELLWVWNEDKDRRDQILNIINPEYSCEWTYGGVMVLMQLVKIVAEWELYQSLIAAKTIDSLYNDFINDGKMNKIETIMEKVHKVRKQKAEKWQIEYARGRRTLEETIVDYRNALGKLLFENPKYKKSEITKFVKSQDMKTYIKSKINVNTFDIKNSKLKSQFQGLKDEIILNLHSEMKKIKYGKLKADVMDIGGRLIGLATKRSGLNSKNVLVINNKSLRDNFDLKRRKNVDTNTKIIDRQFSSQKDTNSRKDVYQTPNIVGRQIASNFEKEPLMFDFGVNPFIYDPTDRHESWNRGAGNWVQCPITELINNEKFFEDYNVWYQAKSEDRGACVALEDASVTFFNASGNNGYFPTRDDSYVVVYKGGWVQTKYGGNTQYWYCYFTVAYPISGYSYDYVYETIDEKNNFHLTHVRNFYNNNHELVFQDFLTIEPSQKSHAAIYKGKYDEKSLKEVYNLSSDAINGILLQYNDNIEKEMLSLMEERLEILNELHKKWKSTNGVLMIDVLY